MLSWLKNKIVKPVFTEGYYIAEDRNTDESRRRDGRQIIYYEPDCVFESTTRSSYNRSAVRYAFIGQNYDFANWNFLSTMTLNPRDFIQGYESFSKMDGWYPAFMVGSRRGIHFVYYENQEKNAWHPKQAECLSMFDVYCQNRNPKNWTLLRDTPMDLDKINAIEV